MTRGQARKTFAFALRTTPLVVACVLAAPFAAYVLLIVFGLLGARPLLWMAHGLFHSPPEHIGTASWASLAVGLLGLAVGPKPGRTRWFYVAALVLPIVAGVLSVFSCKLLAMTVTFNTNIFSTY